MRVRLLPLLMRYVCIFFPCAGDKCYHLLCTIHSFSHKCIDEHSMSIHLAPSVCQQLLCVIKAQTSNIGCFRQIHDLHLPHKKLKKVKILTFSQMVGNQQVSEFRSSDLVSWCFFHCIAIKGNQLQYSKFYLKQ